LTKKLNFFVEICIYIIVLREMIEMKSDGHVHSPFCPHGSTDNFAEYIEKALYVGMNEISFTEHAPLPSGFIDPTPDKDSGMNPEILSAYLNELNKIKEYYKTAIRINIGLEVDFINGFEKETKDFLDETGQVLDDSILSVHFLKQDNAWHCIDFSSDTFKVISGLFGGIDEVYEEYYSTVKKAIISDLGVFKPKRIGHLTLIHKFQKKYPATKNFDQHLFDLLDLVKSKGYSLDYNGAGAIKPLCGETYPPERFAVYAASLGIPLVYGSDAHQAEDLGQGYRNISRQVPLSFPAEKDTKEG
jgi:histidinol-phosphatase (PHP family)